MLTIDHDTLATIAERVANNETPQVTGAFKVDPFRGSNSGEVSKQWASRPADQRFMNLGDLRDTLRTRADATKAKPIESKLLQFVAPEPETLDDTNKLAIEFPGGYRASPTHWAFGQLATLADFSPTELRKLPTPLVADVLNWQMRNARKVDEVKVFVRPREGVIPAVTGPKYGWIPDADMVEAVQTIAGNGTGDSRWKIPGVLDWRTHMYDPFAPVTIDSTTLYASDRDVFMFLVDDTHPIEIGKLKDGSPDYIFRGFWAKNSETGSGCAELAAFYLRGVCMNRNIWGLERFETMKIRHTSQAPVRFIQEATPALLSFANGSSSRLIEGVTKAKEAIVATDQAEGLAFLRNRGLSGKRAKAVMLRDTESGGLREEGDFPRSVWDFAQAITAEARDIPNTDTRMDLESVAGAMLDKVA